MAAALPFLSAAGGSSSQIQGFTPIGMGPKMQMPSLQRQQPQNFDFSQFQMPTAGMGDFNSAPAQPQTNFFQNLYGSGSSSLA